MRNKRISRRRILPERTVQKGHIEDESEIFVEGTKRRGRQIIVVFGTERKRSGGCVRLCVYTYVYICVRSETITTKRHKCLMKTSKKNETNIIVRHNSQSSPKPKSVCTSDQDLTGELLKTLKSFQFIGLKEELFNAMMNMNEVIPTIPNIYFILHFMSRVDEYQISVKDSN